MQVQMPTQTHNLHDETFLRAAELRLFNFSLPPSFSDTSGGQIAAMDIWGTRFRQHSARGTLERGLQNLPQD